MICISKATVGPHSRSVALSLFSLKNTTNEKDTTGF
jgi:hypothetical protein